MRVGAWAHTFPGERIFGYVCIADAADFLPGMRAYAKVPNLPYNSFVCLYLFCMWSDFSIFRQVLGTFARREARKRLKPRARPQGVRLRGQGFI